jgi:nicotinamide mononucleotide transporter
VDAFAAFFSDPVEVAGAVLTVVSIALIVRQNLWGWPVGIAATLLYLPVFWQAQLYGDLGLYVVFLGAQVWGWSVWLRGGAEGGPLLPGRAARGRLAGLMGAGIVATAGLGWLLWRAGGSLPLADGFTTAFALVASLQQAYKWIENWPTWIVVNTVATGVYAIKGLWPTAVLYLILLGLAVAGWREWSRALSAAPVGA